MKYSKERLIQQIIHWCLTSKPGEKMMFFSMRDDGKKHLRECIEAAHKQIERHLPDHLEKFVGMDTGLGDKSVIQLMERQPGLKPDYIIVDECFDDKPLSPESIKRLNTWWTKELKPTIPTAGHLYQCPPRKK